MNINLGGTITAFADDVQIVYISKVADVVGCLEVIKTDLHKIKNRFERFGFKLNENKTVITRFGTKQQLAKLQNPLQIDFGQLVLKVTSETKNLGVYFDENMSFRKHFIETSKKCNKILYCFRTIRDYMSDDTLLMLVHTFILSRITFASSLTSVATKETKKYYIEIINFAARSLA